MNSPTWIDGLRVIFIIGMAYGAWNGWKNRPPKIRHEGRSYYRLPDGRFSNAWGKVLKDPATAAELEARFQAGEFKGPNKS